MRSRLAALGAFVVVVAAFFVVLERPGWLPASGASWPGERVLVFLVGDEERVRSVHDAVDPARIVYRRDSVLALVEGRIVATDAPAATEAANALGWRDRHFEIFRFERVDPYAGRGRPNEGRAADPPDPARLARLRELAAKPTLSDGEQLVVLQAMNDGIEF